MDLINNICDLAKATNANFTLYGKSISHEEVFSETGLLPTIVQRADQMCLLCFGYGIGVSFVEADPSLLGVSVQFDDITPNILRLVYIYDVVLEIIQASPDKEQVALDELLYD